MKRYRYRYLDDNGDWVRDYLTLTVKDGKYVLYEE